jgi:hypothetical protein
MPETTASTAEVWPTLDPGLIEQGRPALPEFPLHVLSPFWRTWVSETASVVDAPVDYIAQALLGSVAGVCGSGVVARLGQGWDEPLILWLALVGGPSTGKSAALDTLRRALAAVEKTAGREGRGPCVIERPTTLPALLAAAGKRPAGALLWRDEAVHWLPSLGCNGRREPVDVSALLAAWSPLRTALGAGSPAVSLVGCLDPARLGEALAGSEDGRAARLLYAWPRPALYQSFLERPELRESDAVNALQRIAAISGDGAAPLALLPNEQALKVFDRHLAKLHEALPRCSGVEAAWLGKGRGTVARLAAALVLLGWAAVASSVAPLPRVLSDEAMIAAVTLWDYFRQHALAVLSRGVASQTDHRMRQVVDWLRLSRLPRVSRREVRREALGQALDAHQTLQLLEQLERAGCVRRAAIAASANGGPRPLRWDVNPSLIGESPALTAVTAVTAVTAPTTP